MQKLFHHFAQAHQLALKRAFSSDEVTPSQGLALSLIRDGCRIAKDVAARLGYGTGATTRILDDLEGNGWIRRDRSNPDRRKRDLSLTDAGKSLADLFSTRRAALWNEWLSTWDAGEVDALVRLLRRLDATFTEARVTD